MEGSEAIAEAMVAAGCRFFAGYPMTPFTEVLEHMARLLPEVGGVVHQRRERARGGRHGLGRSRHRTRAATGSVGQGLSLMQESLSEICFARVPARRRSTWPGARATTSRPPGAAATATTATSCWPPPTSPRRCGWSSWPSTWPTCGATRSSSWATTTWPTSRRRSTSTPLDFGPLPAKDWALDGSTGGTGHAKLVSPISSRKRNDPDPIDYGDYSWSSAAAPRRDDGGRRAAWSRPGSPRTPSSSWSPTARPARYIRYVVRSSGPQGLPGRVRPADHPVAVPDRGGPRRGRPDDPGRRRLRAQRRPDDRRRPPGRPRPGAGALHRRHQLRRLRLRHRARPRRRPGRRAHPTDLGPTSSGRQHDDDAGPPLRPSARPGRPAWSTTSRPR